MDLDVGEAGVKGQGKSKLSKPLTGTPGVGNILQNFSEVERLLVEPLGEIERRAADTV